MKKPLKTRTQSILSLVALATFAVATTSSAYAGTPEDDRKTAALQLRFVKAGEVNLMRDLIGKSFLCSGRSAKKNDTRTVSGFPILFRGISYPVHYMAISDEFYGNIKDLTFASYTDRVLDMFLLGRLGSGRIYIRTNFDAKRGLPTADGMPRRESNGNLIIEWSTPLEGHAKPVVALSTFRDSSSLGYDFGTNNHSFEFERNLKSLRDKDYTADRFKAYDYNLISYSVCKPTS